MPVKVCLGGTFNIIHEGHIALLSRAFQEGDEVYVGLTGNAMAARGRSVPVRDFHARLQDLTMQLSRLSCGKHFYVFQIDDEMGPAAREDYNVIVVSEETVFGAEKINKMRVAGGLKPLKIVIIEMVLDQGKPVSSTRIIRGNIPNKRSNPEHNP